MSDEAVEMFNLLEGNKWNQINLIN
jgi:hypothetical protein